MGEVIKFGPPSAKMPGVKSFPVSWELLHSEMWRLAQRLQSLYPTISDAVVITRGGLGVSSMLTAFLGEVKNIETFGVTSYSPTRERSGLRVRKSISVEWLRSLDGRPVYLFEDVADSGVTAQFARDEMKRLRIKDYVFVAAVVKPMGKPLIDHYAMEVGQDEWVDFPWDWKVLPPPSLRHVPDFDEPEVLTARGDY